jgi:hypothetical protein
MSVKGCLVPASTAVAVVAIVCGGDSGSDSTATPPLSQLWRRQQRHRPIQHPFRVRRRCRPLPHRPPCLQRRLRAHQPPRRSPSQQTPRPHRPPRPNWSRSARRCRRQLLRLRLRLFVLTLPVMTATVETSERSKRPRPSTRRPEAPPLTATGSTVTAMESRVRACREGGSKLTTGRDGYRVQ